MVIRYLNEYLPDVYIITYMDSVNKYYLEQFINRPIEYYFYWFNHFNDGSQKSNQSIVSNTQLVELEVPLTIAKATTPVKVLYKDEEPIESEVDLIFGQPMIIVQPKDKLPVL